MFKTTKAKVIFVSIFSIICLIVTAILIVYQNIEIEDKNQEITGAISKETNVKDVPGIDLKGTYNENDLLIEEKSVTKEKIEIRYFQISGLKNKTIENKINKEIESVALNCYKEKVKDLGEVLNVQVSMWEASNFANTVSFELSYSAKIDDDDDGFYQGIKCLNYDLNTGEQITFDKLFTSDAPMENILRKSAYYNFISCEIEENLAGDLIISDYGEIENEIVKIINSYKKGKITEFYYTPMQINVYYKENQMINIKMEDFAEYIAIYNRYLSEESLYNSNNVGMKDIYTLTKRYKDVYYYTNYQNEDNYFVDVSIDFQCTLDDEFAKELVENKISEIENEIIKIKQKVSEDPHNFYVLNYYISIYSGQDWGTAQEYTSCYERGNCYEMTVHDFEENIEPIIIKYARMDENGGVPDYIYDFSEMLDIEPQETTEYYNPETEEKIVI